MSYSPHITENSWYELTQGSGIAPSLAALNCEIIQGDAVYEALLYAKPRAEVRRNDGRLKDYWLNRYKALAEAGGLYFSGLDPQNNWEPMEWGRLKANSPRIGSDGKPQKYESPIKPATNRVSYFRVDLKTWELVTLRYGLLMPENIPLSSEGEAIGFWSWVVEHPEIPIILTEGEKKAQCLLSMGFVAISLPGIWGGRVGRLFLEQFHPDLMPVAQKGRKFTILFDYETKTKTKQHIFNASRRTGECIINAGCECEIALLPGPEKGIDDWVVAQGLKANQAVTNLLSDALSLEDYRKSFFIPIRRLKKFKPNVEFNLQYLSEGIKHLPESGLVALLSDLNTGKTFLLEKWRDDHPDERFLNNGHRVNLLKNLAERLKTEMYSAVNSGDLGRIQALSITIDSLHKMANNLQAYACLFIDEAAQYLSHLLRSKTCKSFRAEILEVLEYLVRNSKLVVLADAHLDDVTIEFFQKMRREGEQPFIIQNHWKSGGRDVFWYEENSSSAIVASIHIALLQDKKVIVVADSKRFVKKLERSLIDSPDFGGVQIDENLEESETDRRLRIWALHSENSGNEENVTRIKDITNAVKEFDVLIASPTIGTGVDICGGKGDYHFDAIFGVFHAVSQPATECAQQLWRYRPNVPMHVWVAPRPPFGYAECNPRKIKEQILQKNEMTAFLIRIDRETGKRGAEKDWALDAYCQIEARRNRSINNLRQDLRSLLEEMGNFIIPVDEGVNEAAKTRMKLAGQVIDQEHCRAVTNSKVIDKLTYDSRQKKDFLSPEEFLECEKFRIQDTYGMEVTEELVKRDDGGRLIRKISNLEAILADSEGVITDNQGREHLAPPKIVVEADLSDRENLPICTDWGNRSTAWMMRNKLKLGELLKSLIQGAEYSFDSSLIQPTVEASHQFAAHVKAILGRTISPEASHTKIIGEYLSQLGLSTLSRRPKEGNRTRVYQLKPDDVAFALQVISHRQEKRRERERKREEAAKKNALYLAGIEAKWGTQAMSTPPLKGVGSTNRGGVDLTTESVEMPTEGWTETIEAYGQLLVEVVEYGVEVIREVILPWTSEERWGAFLKFDELAPEKMQSLASITPNWYEWCEV